jgi:hypothetical protein
VRRVRRVRRARRVRRVSHTGGAGRWCTGWRWHVGVLSLAQPQRIPCTLETESKEGRNRVLKRSVEE